MENKFCSTCGKKINKEAVICPKCGVEQSTVEKKKKFSIGWFIFWLIICWPVAVVYAIIRS